MIRFFTLAILVVFTALPARAQILDIQEVRSDSGITAWLAEDHSVPVIALQFAFKGAGARGDGKDKQGLSRLASNTMDEGAGEMDSQKFQKALRDDSITLFFNSNRDDFGGNLKTLTRNKDKAFDLLRLALTSPRFDADPMRRMRQSNQARIRHSLADPEWAAARIMNDRAFAGHPYALNSGGTLSTLENITREDQQNFTATKLARDNLHVAVAGDITADELRAALDGIFGALPDKATLPETPPLKLQNKGQVYAFEKDIPQTIIQIMQPGIARNDPAYHHAQIMNFVLGSSGFGSRLTEEIRENRGLTYGIYSSLFTMDNFAGLSVNTSTANENTAQMQKLIREEWDQMKREGVSDEELQSAKTYLIGALPLSLTSTDQIAGTMLSLRLDNLPRNYLDQRTAIIENATREDIHDIAQNLLNDKEFITVLVGGINNIAAHSISGAVVIESLPNAQ